MPSSFQLYPSDTIHQTLAYNRENWISFYPIRQRLNLLLREQYRWMFQKATGPIAFHNTHRYCTLSDIFKHYVNVILNQYDQFVCSQIEMRKAVSRAKWNLSARGEKENVWLSRVTSRSTQATTNRESTRVRIWTKIWVYQFQISYMNVQPNLCTF